MTETILRDHLALVDVLTLESTTLKTGLDLLESMIDFNRSDEEEASAAQDRLYFIAGALSESQKRFQELAVHAEALLRKNEALRVKAEGLS